LFDFKVWPNGSNAGSPPGVINIVTGFGDSLGNPLTSHRLVKRIAFTGGVESARHVVRNSANNFSKISLELGGKSPNIVFENANIENATMGIIAGIFAAIGQSCVAGSRAFLHDDIYKEILKPIVDRVLTIKIDNPMSDDTETEPWLHYTAKKCGEICFPWYTRRWENHIWWKKIRTHARRFLL
jgi:acyl-CoA reductase-like NAD-dependent aldehyde dehydrogenase